MPSIIIWSVAIVVAAIAIDRILLWMESRNWIYYRRSKGGPRGAIYHARELHAIFDPGIRHVQEIQVKEEEEEDESGDPPVESNDVPNRRTEGDTR